MLEPLSPAFAIGGGLLIGGAAALLLMLTGRIAGVSGMFATMVRIADAGPPWKLAAAFILGLPFGAALTSLLVRKPDIEVTSSVPLLIAAGLLFGAIGGAVLLIDSIRGGSWVSFLLLLAAWIAEFINSLVHARDGWTAVVPTGLILSVIGSLLILASGWTWRPIRYWTPGERT